jgi:hypothetical protein
VLGRAATRTHKIHHNADLGEATTFPLIVYSTALHGGYIHMVIFPGTPKLESWNCPEIVPVRALGLWELITLDCGVWSRRGPHQSCSSPRELSNAVSHSRIRCRVPSPSFGHNLCFRCSNEQCEPILDIYVSRAFPWYKERNNPLRFDPSTRPLKFGSPPELPLLKWELPWECECSLLHTPLHFLKLPGVCDDSRASSWPAPFQCLLCLRSRASFLLACNLAMLLPWLLGFLPFGPQPCNPLPWLGAQS